MALTVLRGRDGPVKHPLPVKARNALAAPAAGTLPAAQPIPQELAAQGLPGEGAAGGSADRPIRLGLSE